MEANMRPLHWVETSAILYLVTPLFIFFAFFVRPEIAVPSCMLISFLAYDLVRQTSWHEFLLCRWESLYFSLLAALWMWLAGGIAPLSLAQNDDWEKHNLIISLLTENPWPVTVKLPNFGNFDLRYYIGWHLVPSAILKLLHVHSPTLAASIWSMLGVFLFFSLLPGIVGNRSAVIAAAPLVFILFGGVDFIGAHITKNSLGPLHHYEWWVGWAQFSSSTTALFWSPQQALPAWLATAILMRSSRADRLLPYCVFLGSATMLWSPFVAIGLLPFFLILSIQHGLRNIFVGWRAIVSTLLVAIPVGLYLSAGSGIIPHGFIWAFPCTPDSCFTWPSYLLFLAIEIGAPLTILLTWNSSEYRFVIAATGALCIIPLYKMGVANDFVMRASLPSLAVLAILLSKFFAGPRRYSIAVIALLLLVFPSILGEFLRGFRSDSKPSPISLTTLNDMPKWWLDQAFAPRPIWVLRKTSEELQRSAD
jgi:hypothetical protein